MTSDSQDHPQIDPRVIVEKLTDMPEAIWNRVDREARESLEAVHKGLPMFLRSTTKVSAQTFKAVKVLTIDKRAGDSPPPTLAIAVPLLSRRFAESIFACVFLFEEPAERMDRFMKGGWREAREDQDRTEARHAGDPTWAAFLKDRRKWVDSHERDLGLTQNEQNDLKKVKFWPTPPQILRDKLVANAQRLSFLEALSERHYSELSQDAHLSYMGMARASVVEDLHLGETQKKYRSQVLTTALILYLAVLSEVSIAACLREEKRRLREVWQELLLLDEAKALWDARYDALL